MSATVSGAFQQTSRIRLRRAADGAPLRGKPGLQGLLVQGLEPGAPPERCKGVGRAEGATGGGGHGG